MATSVTFAKTGNRLISKAHDPVARSDLYGVLKEDNEFSRMQLLELDNLHQVGYVPVDLGVYKKGDTVPLWVAPIEDVTFSSVNPAQSTTSTSSRSSVARRGLAGPPRPRTWRRRRADFASIVQPRLGALITFHSRASVSRRALGHFFGAAR